VKALALDGDAITVAHDLDDGRNAPARRHRSIPSRWRTVATVKGVGRVSVTSSVAGLPSVGATNRVAARSAAREIDPAALARSMSASKARRSPLPRQRRSARRGCRDHPAGLC
jgi:hypothetical protein